MANVWDATTNDEIDKHITEYIDQREERFTGAIYALLGGLVIPLLYPIFLWLLAGFRKSDLTVRGKI